MVNKKNDNTVGEGNNLDVVALQQQVKDLQELMRTLVKNNEEVKETTVNEKNVSNENDMNRYITIVHLEDRAEGLFTWFKAANREFRFSRFGETRKVRLIEFEDIIGQHFNLFKKNVLTLGDDANDILESYNLPRDEDIILNTYQFEHLIDMSLEELKTLYNKVCNTHKNLITRRWVQGYYEGKDKRYNNRQVIDMFNELSNGALENILIDLDEKRRRNKN